MSPELDPRSYADGITVWVKTRADELRDAMLEVAARAKWDSTEAGIIDRPFDLLPEDQRRTLISWQYEDNGWIFDALTPVVSQALNDIDRRRCCTACRATGGCTHQPRNPLQTAHNTSREGC